LVVAYGRWLLHRCFEVHADAGRDEVPGDEYVGHNRHARRTARAEPGTTDVVVAPMSPALACSQLIDKPAWRPAP
jgi:hypothetical protein